jgi:TolB-like protein/Tfp pilus assembly protein PilF
MADLAESENSGSPTEATAGPPRLLFISYASHDAEVAQKVCSALEGAGFPCWMAPRDVRPGAQYADAIVGALNDARALVLVLSANAIASSHVGREVERAASKHKPIIAFRTDAAALNRALEYFLGESQWIDVPKLGMPAALAKLAEAVGSWSATSARESPVTDRSDGELKRVAGVAALVIGVGVATAIGAHLWSLSRSGAAPPAVAPSGANDTTVMPISDNSIAVLPFTDMSEKKDQEYFADGMAEEILNLLVKIPGLTVIGRTSSFQFKSANQDLRSIGSKLSAAYLVEGSVRRTQETIRVTAQLINTRTGGHVWSETYDRPVGAMLQVQDEIAASLARSLQVTVEADHKKSRQRSGNLQAYDLYLRARNAYERRDRDGLAMAATYFRQSLDLDPEFAGAATGLAFTYYLQAVPGEGYERARQAAEAAVKLAPELGEPHALLGAIHAEHDWDFPAAEREFKTALALEPHDASVLALASQLQQQLGNDAKAIEMLKESLAHDPLLTPAYGMLAWIEARSGRLADAEAAQRRVLAIDPSGDRNHADLAAILLLRGDLGAALAENMRETDLMAKTQAFALIYHALGRKADADASLMTLTREGADDHEFKIAQVYAYRGNRDRAFEWLDRAYLKRDPDLAGFKKDPFLKNLESDFRYKAFLRKLKLPE